MPHAKLSRFCMLLLLLLGMNNAWAQDNYQVVKGVVFDMSQRTPIESVTVLATNGRGTMTDSLGRYQIGVRESDSIYFSYQNKITGKFPVKDIEDITQFNMSLHVQVKALPPVTIFGRNYRMDSLANRRDYAKYFDWEKPNPLSGNTGLDPTAIINLFRFKRNSQLASLRNRLVTQEQDRYVDFRYNKTFVKRVTGLQDEALQKFMFKYRPPYDFLVIVNELELGYYIQQCYKKEMGMLPPGVDIYLLGVQPLEREAIRQ